MNIIKYNNKNIGLPTPLVTLETNSIFDGEKLGDINKIKLIGQLTGNYNQLTGSQFELIKIFSENFKNFEIYEDNQKIYEKSGIIIDSIDFGDSNYYGILNYEINLTSKNFNYNIQNPVNEFDMQKENNLITLTHTVSAQGINTSSTNKSNALQNAIDFVNNFTGLSSVPKFFIDENIGIPDVLYITNTFNSNYNGKYKRSKFEDENIWVYENNPLIVLKSPHNGTSWIFINNGLVINALISENLNQNKLQVPLTGWNPPIKIDLLESNFLLTEQKESLNRLDGAYSIEEVYVKDISSDYDNSGILRYSIDYNSGIDQGAVAFTVKGNYYGSPINNNINNLRNNFINNIKPNLGNKIIKDYLTGVYEGYINPNPINSNIVENSGANSIEFTFEFDNINLPNPYFNYTSSISRDEVSQIISINLSAEIIARGTLSNKINIINQYENILENSIYNVVSGIYQKYIEYNDYPFEYKLRFIKRENKKDLNNGKLIISHVYDDKEIPDGVADADYSISKEMPVWYFGINPTLQDKTYIFQDFDIHTPLRITHDVNILYSNSYSDPKNFINIILNTGDEQKVKEEKIEIKKSKAGIPISAKATNQSFYYTEKAFLPKSI